MKYKTTALLPSAIILAILTGCGGGTDAPIASPILGTTPIAVTPSPAAPTPVAAAPGAAPAPVVTTPAPVVTTPAPVVTTPAPGETPAPIAGNPAPVPVSPPTVPTTPPTVIATPPAVTVAPNCAAFANGTYQLVSPKALTDGQLAFKVTFDAATLRTTAANGTFTQWTADASSCSFTASNATMQISKSGLGVLRSLDSNGNGVFSLIFPSQNFSLAELAGELNFISYDQEIGSPNYSVVSGTYSVSNAGEFTNGTICMFSSFCNPSSWPSQFTTNAAGGFNYKDVNGSNLRAFGFKAANGGKIFIAVRANAGGIVIAAPQQALVSYAQNLSPRAVEMSTTGSVSALANRQLIAILGDRPNDPLNGFAILNVDPDSVFTEIAIPLPNLGVSAWIRPGNKSFGFAVDR
jgi:hypothetical protein